MVILDGKKTSAEIKEELKVKVDAILATGNRAPHLAAVLIGDDGASQTYVNAKMKSCEKIGFRSSLYTYPASTTEEELLAKIDAMNNDEELDGFIIQLPLPNHIDETKVTLAVAPKKDVDGFHPENLGRMTIGLEAFVPATPYGIMQLLKRYNVDTQGKNCVVLGRSNIVGRPMSILLSQKGNPGNATVTVAHSKTQNLKEICASADILIVAIGKPEFLTADMVKYGAVVVDVGIHRIEDTSKKNGFRLVGDVKKEEVAEKCSFFSPVPGGVGPMTITGLMMNTLDAYNRKF